MVISFSLIQILTVTFIHDLSREYDLKECFLLKEKEENVKVDRADDCEPKTENIKTEKIVAKQINKYNSKNKNIANSLKRLFFKLRFGLDLSFSLVILLLLCIYCLVSPHDRLKGIKI